MGKITDQLKKVRVGSYGGHRPRLYLPKVPPSSACEACVVAPPMDEADPPVDEPPVDETPVDETPEENNRDLESVAQEDAPTEESSSTRKKRKSRKK